MNIEGKITYIGSEETVWSQGLRKRTFVVEEVSDKEWKSSLAIDLFKDKTALLDGLQIGTFVKVGINYKANQYNGKWFNSISAWKIDAVANNNGSGAANDTAWFTPSYQQVDEDLPF